MISSSALASDLGRCLGDFGDEVHRVTNGRRGDAVRGFVEHEILVEEGDTDNPLGRQIPVFWTNIRLRQGEHLAYDGRRHLIADVQAENGLYKCRLTDERVAINV